MVNYLYRVFYPINSRDFKSRGIDRFNKICPTIAARDYKDPKNVIVENKMSKNKEVEKVRIKQATKKGYIECKVGGVADLSYPKSKLRRGRVQEGGDVSPTLTTEPDGICKIEKYAIRKLTPRECWRLMGFNDDEFDRAEKVNSNTQLYKQAGNSIVVPVLSAIFKSILEPSNESNKKKTLF